MAITFQIKNTRIDGDELVVFYEFSNEEKNSNKFKKTAKVVDILDWGTKRGKWFDDREILLIQLKKDADKFAEDERLTLEQQ